MRKLAFSISLLALLAVSGTASAVPVELVAHNQRSSSGTLSTLIWKTCPVPGPGENYVAPCVKPDNPWAQANGVVGSNATWDWNPATGVLTATGLFQTTSHISSNPNGAAVISDKVVDLVINTQAQMTTATAYDCVEGNFLASVGAHGCSNLNLGGDFVYNSSMAYNVGGDANCVQRTISGDDQDTGNPRSLADTAGGAGCDPGDGAFNLWTVTDDTATGGQLRIANDVPIDQAGTNYLTFQVVAGAVDDGPFEVAQATATPLDVLANDVGFADPVTVAIVTPPTKGTAVVVGSPGNQAAITIEYTSNGGATGADSFVYSVTSGGGAPSEATVSLNILAFGANDDTASTTRNKPVNISVGANDVGFADPVTIVITVAPDAGGTATPPAPGALAGAVIAYTPATTATGTAMYTETFTYEVTDADDQTDTATVTVTVNNTVPVANNTTLTISTTGSAPGSATGAFNAGTLAGNSLGNTPSTVTKTDGTKGTVAVSGSNVTYTPAGTFFSGSDTFTYTITDSDPGTPETATGTVTVNIPNATPTVAGDPATSGNQGTTLSGSGAFTAGNGSVAQHTLSVQTQAVSGTCGTPTVSGSNIVVPYTPNASFTGNDSCVVRLVDGDGDGANGTYSFTVNAAGGGGGGGASLPTGSSSFDLWSLSLLAGLPWLRRRRLARASQAASGDRGRT